MKRTTIPIWHTVLLNINQVIFKNYNPPPMAIISQSSSIRLIPSHLLNRLNVYYIMYQRAYQNPPPPTPTTLVTQSSGVASQGTPYQTPAENALYQIILPNEHNMLRLCYMVAHISNPFNIHPIIGDLPS